MNTFTFALGLTLMHFLWQGLLLGCAAAIALALLRNRRAEYRYIVACAALLACLGWPAFDLWQRMAAHVAYNGAGMHPPSFAMRDMPADAGWFRLGDSLRAVVGLWALCAAALSLRMLLGLLWIDRKTRQHSDCSRDEQQHWDAALARLARHIGLTRAVRLRIITTLASPVTAGWWRPVVLVPAALIGRMPPELLEALLAHELAHIKRHDYLINLLQNVIETLLFYHPAVWWLSNRIRVERELIADALAARTLVEPRRLALALSELEKLQFSTHQLALAANGGNLMMRIQQLLRPAPQTLNWKAAIAMLGVATACVSVYAQATAADQQASKQTSSDSYKQAVVDFKSCAKPVWPDGAIAAKHTGTVHLAFLVATNGQVKASEVKEGSGHPDLDQAARTGIEKCTFKPATQAGQPVESWVQLQYVWVLE
ncbi:M56 family metallopeptidase [Duganella callida]|uniref:M56 family peptidase n=1 Tax=Duganella callida TaxID=2561932 RepID=A0A4Y9SG86_9BURK|nr:M56 family metallopeptidase [Duganella callida]TFW20296.1 M56 family peptidase [Duganella callida]